MGLPDAIENSPDEKTPFSMAPTCLCASSGDNTQVDPTKQFDVCHVEVAFVLKRERENQG